MKTIRLVAGVVIVASLPLAASAAQEPGCLPGPIPGRPSRQVSEVDYPPPVGPVATVRYCSAAIGRGLIYNVPQGAEPVRAEPVFAIRARS